MEDNLSGRMWVERVQLDPSLRAFVAAELARERIATDTLRHVDSICLEVPR